MSAEAQKKRVGDFLAAEWHRLVRFVRARIADSAEADAEDIVQDVMTGIFERADVTAPIVDLAGYVYRSLANRVIDALRARRPSVAAGVPAETLPDRRYEASLQAQQAQTREELLAAVEALPPAQRAVLLATELDGEGYRELAERWGVPIGTLLARKHRAVRALRRTLEAGMTREGGER